MTAFNLKCLSKSLEWPYISLPDDPLVQWVMMTYTCSSTTERSTLLQQTGMRNSRMTELQTGWQLLKLEKWIQKSRSSPQSYLSRICDFFNSNNRTCSHCIVGWSREVLEAHMRDILFKQVDHVPKIPGDLPCRPSTRTTNLALQKLEAVPLLCKLNSLFSTQ